MSARPTRTSDPPVGGPGGRAVSGGGGGPASTGPTVAGPTVAGPTAAGGGAAGLGVSGAGTSGAANPTGAGPTGASTTGRPARPRLGESRPLGRESFLLPGTPRPAHDEDAPVYVISIAAELAGMHPQTLRSYDRLGLVTPGRTAGRGRRYSARDVALLREVQRLSQEEGVNLEGIRQVLRLGAQLMALQAQVRELADELVKARAEADRRVAEAHASHRRDLVPIDRGAVVVWRPGHRR